uniref:SWIM-type domain-containing protein n=1 Tax=Picocystis salinarum TaxID=88271 RepID=A0A7S3XFL1_9CHLO|mmetsp:Transcript_5821/g.36118  ORF Transcript_5821/g.36118 Transcript_5821/m.36118 type:complete len:285 (+) Transcript_5821:346-1200(+)|eukprot:CAMPEP_0183825556 /NCGR_PEP_ID=MMETSP0807_2-20130328/1199_1 /TAXON_ID=88271 /ORGANISM="Picocystis salinarum, Strain CCMP1897" /LENGTH=284 /DNA_ID=CAMNT_0026070561 /DNA_START=463 /DNA_END=1317 /DNA_ORIENTATION=-
MAKVRASNTKKQKPNYTQYEVERDEHVQRNLERMRALGIPKTKREMERTAEEEKQKKRKEKQKRKETVESHAADETNTYHRPVTRSQGMPSRRSTRSDKRDAVKREQEFSDALGQFLVDGTCPKCKRVYERNHRSHLMKCTGKIRPAPSKEETEMKKKQHAQRSASRMMQLLFDGVVSFDGEVAKFSVIGSSGNAYTLTFSDHKRRRCTCPDHRFRHRDCKHILLAMKVLGIEGKKEKQWRAATAQYIEEEGMGSSRDRPTLSKKIKTEPMPRTKEETVAIDFL